MEREREREWRRREGGRRGGGRQRERRRGRKSEDSLHRFLTTLL